MCMSRTVPAMSPTWPECSPRRLSRGSIPLWLTRGGSLPVEPVVVIVDNLDGEDIDDYATELFELWKPGKKDKDNGVILLISRDDRKFVIRTGYGVEGVLPDALCWTILNQTMKPYFQQGDYDGGVVAAATDLNRVLTDDEARAELMSKYKNDSEGAGADDFFKVYLSICLILLVAFAVYYFCLLVNSRGKDTAEAYHLFEKNKLAVMVLTAATLGIMGSGADCLAADNEAYPHTSPSLFQLLHTDDTP